MSEAAVIARGTMNGSPAPAGSVLIIDDEAEIRESLQTLLELEGFEVETAGTGEDGLAILASEDRDQPAVARVEIDVALAGVVEVRLLEDERHAEQALPEVDRSLPICADQRDVMQTLGLKLLHLVLP